MTKVNRTTNLLLTFYSEFGNEFISVFNAIAGKGLYNVRLYFGDHHYSKSSDENLIFVQVLEECFNFEKYLLQIQSHPSYITDYQEDNYKVIVFEVKEPYIKALHYLKKSQYNKMFKSSAIEKWFGMTKGYYLIYKSDKQEVIFPEIVEGTKIDMNTLKDRWDRIGDENFFQNLLISPYHMLLKTPELKELLEHIYGSKIPEENELIEPIKLKEEILHYEEVLD